MYIRSTFKFYVLIFSKFMIEEIRAVVHYFYLNDIPAASAAAKLYTTYGEAAMTRTGVLYWYSKFREGRTDTSPAPRPGRPLQNERVDAIQAILEESPYASARYISTQVKLSVNTVIRILKIELHMKKRYRRWVPKILSDKQKEIRKELSLKMLRVLERLSPAQRLSVVTCDESWFYLSYGHDSKWVAEGEEPPTSGKRLIDDEKVMIFSSFSIGGLVLLKALPTNTHFNSTYMCEHILPDLTTNAKKLTAGRTKHSLIYILTMRNLTKQSKQQQKSKIWVGKHSINPHILLTYHQMTSSFMGISSQNFLIIMLRRHMIS